MILKESTLHRAPLGAVFVYPDTGLAKMIQRAMTTDSIESTAEFYGLDILDLSDLIPDQELLSLFPAPILSRENILPISLDSHACRVAISDPTRLEAISLLELHSPRPIEMVLAKPEQIKRILNQRLGVAGSTIHDLVALSDAETQTETSVNDSQSDPTHTSSVIKLVNELITEAISQRASDIHIEPEKHELIVRFRIDGVLYQQNMPIETTRFAAAIVSRIKIMAHLNIAEKRLPQDGRFPLNHSGKEIDVRVSVIPSYHGESVVLRLLSGTEQGLSLNSVGLPETLRGPWNNLIHRPHGLILVTGPTGSGKTTTLYGSLAEIRSEKTKIMTVEDPIEYKLRQVSQIQVQSEIGLDFAAGLRSILRHDPDVILVGEIRDQETARMAIQAAMTGHLVFSTLHTNDAAGALNRLVDMGVEPYLVASTLEAVMAQRLVRRLCTCCRVPVEIDSRQLPKDLALPSDATIYRAKGCKACHNIGYEGRQAIFELLRMNNDIRKLAISRSDSVTVHHQAVQNGMQTLRQSVWDLVCSGVTSLEEFYRVCPTDEN